MNTYMYIFMVIMGSCLFFMFVVTAMMLRKTRGVVSDGDYGRFRRKDKIYVKADDSYKNAGRINQENIGYQPRKTKSYEDQTKKQKKRRFEITTPVKIQNMSSYTHTKFYENGPSKLIEHHHGETKKFIESGADISYLTNHFFCDSFYLSLVTMAVPVTLTDDELEHLRLWNSRALGQEVDQPTGNQTHQNYESDDNAISRNTRNNLSSLVDSHTSSGFNSLTVYDHRESSLTSIPSCYQSVQRRSSVASSSFSFSYRLQVDRPITEDEQNNGYTDNMYNVIEPHTSRSMNDQQFPICSQDLAGQETQQNSTVRGCTTLRGYEEADQLTERGNQNHQNYERDDNAITVDYRRRRRSSRNNLSSLVDSHINSGFNSLTVYDHSEWSLSSYLAIGRNDFSNTSVTSAQQNIHRSTISSGYQYGRRRSSADSRSFQFSLRLQADRPITEEQNNGYTDHNIDNVIDPHTSCSMNDQQFPICSQDLAGQQAHYNIDNMIESHTSCSMNDQQFPICSQDLTGQQTQQNSTVRGYRLRESEIFSRSIPIPQSAIFRHELNTRENNLSSGENTSTASLCESTQRKEVNPSGEIQSSQKTSAEIPPDDNSHDQVALATPTTTASSRPRPQDQPMCNINRATPKGQGKQTSQNDTTESICTADEIQAQKSSQENLLTITCTEDQNERQGSELVGTIFGDASSFLTDDDLFGEGQSPIPNSNLFGDEGEDAVNEITDCSTGDTREEDLPPDD